MFKWRSDKIRISAVFKLQFHATQISEYGGNGLVVSIVPADNGKPTARLEKSRITDDCCYWDNPVYETVKFIQDPKTNKIHDRIYYFLISTGSAKGSLIGEFSVNIADYIATTKACPVSFPFKNSNSDSYLHVTIQRIQENNNLSKAQRDLEESESVRIKEEEDNSLKRHFSNGDVEDGVKLNSIQDQPLRKTASHTLGLNGTHRGSNGSDITLSSSDSSSGLNTPRDGVRIFNSNKDQTSNGSGYQDQQKTQWDLAIVPVNDSSTEYSMNSPRDNLPSLRSSMGLDDSVDMLKADLVALSRRAEVSELELHTLRKQIVKESKKGQDMMREITSLKEERNALKDECEKLKASHKRSDDQRIKSKFQFEGDPWALVEVIREELDYEKEMNANLRLQLQKTQDANDELLLAVQDLEEMLEKNNKGGSHLPNKSISGESAVEIDESIVKSQSDDDEAQKALEDLVRQHSDAQETYMLEQKIMDLCSEIEMYRRDKDELEMQMEQLALDYEILKQENHEYCTKLEQNQLQEQLKMQCDGSSPYTAVRELEAKTLNLEQQLKEKSEELSQCSETIKDLESCNKNLKEELQKQAEGFEASMKAATSAQMEQQQKADQAEASLEEADAIINELESEIEKLKNERKNHLEDLSSSWASIKELQSHNYDLEEELENQAKRYEAEMESLTHAKMEEEQRALKAVAHSSATINELETHIKELEGELKRHSEESSNNLASVKELETHIQNLEEALEQQAEGFEADLESVTRAKVEQEQRAIRAEEALKLMRWKNANTAARIQDEFKRLSSQMQSSFEANEKLASKALTEASELRLQNHHLQDMLQNAHEELQSAKEEYEMKLQEMNSEFNIKSTQIEQMQMEMEEKSKQLETQKKQTDELRRSVSGQELDHRSEMERLASENKSLAEQMKALTEERDLLVQREDTEYNSSVKEVAGKSLEELYMLRILKNEKEQTIIHLKSEVEELRDQCESLKNSVYEDEEEKENLRKQVFQLKSDLKKKDETILSIEKKFKESNGRVVVQDKPKGISKNAKSEPVQRNLKEFGSKEVATLKERIKFLEGQIKSKEAALETSTNAFLTKEKDLNGKIEELEINLRELSQSNPDVDHDELKQEKISVGTQVFCIEDITPAGDVHDEANVAEEKSSNAEPNSNGDIGSDSQPKPSDNDSENLQKFDVLLKEMVLLKEQNQSMEIELNEMQERYSEISLKFAEVEGERQQLIMRVRNLKNSKKT